MARAIDYTKIPKKPGKKYVYGDNRHAATTKQKRLIRQLSEELGFREVRIPVSKTEAIKRIGILLEAKRDLSADVLA